MSYNIEVFAEVKDRDVWVLVGRVHDNFKWYIEANFVADMPTIEHDQLSAGMWYYSPQGESSPKGEPAYPYGDYIAGRRARVISHRDLKEYADRLIEKSTIHKRDLFTALGMPEYVTDEYTEVEDDKYDSDGHIDPAWNPLTHPVDKRLLENIQEADFGFLKAVRIMGMLDSVEALTNSDGDAIRYILLEG